MTGLVAWLRGFPSGHPALCAFLIVVGCAAVLVWYVFYSGLGDPAGFVYSQF